MAGPKIEVHDNLKEVLAEMRRAGIAIQNAGAESLNLGAAYIEQKYKAELKNTFKIRNRFTFGAVRKFKAHGTRKTKELRKLQDINAIVAISNMKGGREHYLYLQEKGGVVSGMRKTGGRVPVPLTVARTGKSENKPVASRYRIANARIDRKTFRNLRGLSPRQQYGAMRSRAKRGGLDKKKLFQTDTGIYRVSSRRVTMVRSTVKSKVRIRGRHLFRKSVNMLTERRMEQSFLIAARRLIREAKLDG